MKGVLEDEILHLPELVKNGGRAIDIGANDGIYSYALAKICDVVEAFEPQPWCSERIAAYSKAFAPNINIHTVALSNYNRSTILHIPLIRGRLITSVASFKKSEYFDGNQDIEVLVHRLDDYQFKNVSLIKIDVEGHESEVLEGARETILRDKPVLIVEIEQRHLDNKPINQVFSNILEFGYEGSFIYKKQFIPLSKFIYEKYQEPFLDNVLSRDYIHNFIFKPL
ncbi:MAG: FkbM family methyltransferase [Coleofasciculus sp. A1-SPW-01]